MQLKPQDFLLSLKLVALAGQRWTYASIAHELGLSASEAHASVKRGLQAGLLESQPVWSVAAPSAGDVLEEPAALYRVRARPRRARATTTVGMGVSEASPLIDNNPARVQADNLVEFAVHGARYAFAAQRLPHASGVPTGRSFPAAARWLPHGEDSWVWPHPQGPVQGHGIDPLHPSVPYAAIQDAALHEMLALFDVLRVGDAGDRGKAAARLRGIIVPGPKR
jgi:hypothetical protein